MESHVWKLMLLALALLGGCASTEETFWVYDRLEDEGGGRGDLSVKAIPFGDSPAVVVEVRERVSLTPGETVTLTEAELACVIPPDVMTRLANIPAGVVMIALTPLAVPVGIGLRVAGVEDIGHCDTLLLPVATLALGAAHTVPVAEMGQGYVFHQEEDSREYRRTGRTSWEKHKSERGQLVVIDSGGPVTGSGYLAEPLAVETTPERISIPRFGVLVRLVTSTGTKSPGHETNVHGAVAFEFDEDTNLRAGFDVEVTIDGRTHRVHLTPADVASLEPVVIERN